MKVVVGALVGAGLLLSALVWGFQERLIYPAPNYEPQELRVLPAGLVKLEDPNQPGSVVGFYRPPLEGGVPHTLWLLFGGNAQPALSWDGVVEPSAGVGYLMVEYPGYGARAGEPTPEALLHGSQVSVAALAAQLTLPVEQLHTRSSALGYSLGAAAALQYAVAQPVNQLVLVAPFTSMLDVTRGLVGFPLCELLRHRYDNLARLRELRKRKLPPLAVLHGDRDSLIPPSMGAALAREAPGARFELVAGAGHFDIIARATPQLRALLAR